MCALKGFWTKRSSKLVSEKDLSESLACVRLRVRVRVRMCVRVRVRVRVLRAGNERK